MNRLVFYGERALFFYVFQANEARTWRRAFPLRACCALLASFALAFARLKIAESLRLFCRLDMDWSVLVFSRLFRCPGIKACPVSSIPRGRSWTFFRAAYVTDWKIIFLIYLPGSKFTITFLSFASHSNKKMSSDFSTKIPSSSVLYLFIISIPRITFSNWWSRTAIDVSSAVINIKNF